MSDAATWETQLSGEERRELARYDRQISRQLKVYEEARRDYGEDNSLTIAARHQLIILRSERRMIQNRASTRHRRQA